MTGRLGLSLADKLYLALGCARGVAALHCYNGVCHRDIKSFNFLGECLSVHVPINTQFLITNTLFIFAYIVDSQLNAKIADLELGVNRDDSGIKTSNHDGFYRSIYDNKMKEFLSHYFGCIFAIGTEKNSDGGMRSLTGAGYVIEDYNTYLANWACPEFLTDGHYTQASDLYSLGLVLWEIFSTSVPYSEIASQDIVRKQVYSIIILIYLY